jgi:voltage-gated potassium channel
MMGLIIISVLMSMIATIDSVSIETKRIIHTAEIIITVLFAAEYFARLYTGRWPFTYALSFYGLVDLVAWIPLLLFDHTFLAIRLLRTLRLLKLLRYMRAIRMLFSSMSDVFDLFFVVLAALLVVILVSGNLIFFLEPETFENAYVGCWWSLVTMTTVGYGDLVPQTILGKVQAGVLMLMGITGFALLTGTISVKLADHLQKRQTCGACANQIPINTNYCPHCGVSQRPGKATPED